MAAKKLNPAVRKPDGDHSKALITKVGLTKVPAWILDISAFQSAKAKGLSDMRATWAWSASELILGGFPWSALLQGCIVDTCANWLLRIKGYDQGLNRKNELELIQPHMAQKPVLRGEVGCACVAREVSKWKFGR